MKIKSSNNQYGLVAITIHWMSAIFIVVLLMTGFRASGMEDEIAKAGVLRIHVSLGVIIFILTLMRIIWWRLADTKPLPVDMPRWQHISAKMIHVLFYVVIIGLAVSGIGMLVASQAAPIIFNSSATDLPDFMAYKPRIPHGIGARLMLVLFIFHVIGALYHHFFKKDKLLNRMWFNQ